MSDAIAMAAARIVPELERPGEVMWYRAPGRVNLIGDHTDYNEGFVMPVAIDRWCVVAARPAALVRVRSLDADGAVEVPADGSAEPAGVQPPWGRYVAGVVRELASRGRPPLGMDAIVASDVPLGSGLSSSAAFEVACAVALAGIARWPAAGQALAEACRVAEEKATGVPCGIMDQLAAVTGRAGCALLIDCRSLETQPVALPAGIQLLAVHSGVRRELRATAYADRRRACELLAHELGLRSLRDARTDQVAHHPLGRHVLSENSRVLEAAAALRAGDARRLGELLLESHASLRDDFRVSTPELDTLVEALVAAGASGARLTGAGFGGCVVALAPSADAHRVAAAATAIYRRSTGRDPTVYPCRAVAGAAQLEAPTAV